MNVPPSLFSQFGYVVRDLERAVDHWAASLGAGPFYRLEVGPGDRVYRGQAGNDTYVAGIGFLGATNVELLQPTNAAPSILREVLDATGEGLHHICPRIAPTDAAQFDELAQRFEAADLEAAMTMRFMGIGRVAFYDLRSEIGSFVEIAEQSRDLFPALQLMYEEHLGWGGTDSLRSFDGLMAKLS